MTPALPLSSYETLRSTDLDETRETLGERFCPISLSPVGGARGVDVRHHSASLGPVSLHYLDWGAEVNLVPHNIEDFYLVHLPQRGSVDIQSGEERAVTSPSLATVAFPQQPLRMHWHADSPHLLVRFERHAVDTMLQQIVPGSRRKPIRFALGQNLTTAPFRRWLAMVNMARRELEQGPRLSTHPLLLGNLRNMLIGGLLVAARHSYSRWVHDDAAPDPTPPVIRKAVAVIEARADEPITVGEIAVDVGVGVRALQKGFRTHLGTTPMGYLRRVRLELVHAELLAAQEGSSVTVTDVAMKWGFFQLGKFAQTYASTFGELPSTTLNR